MNETTQLVSRNETTQLCTAVDRLQLPETAVDRLHHLYSRIGFFYLLRMTPRCLKCGKEHRTGNCTIEGKIEKPRCINCNQEGHVASLRSCTAFPKIKPKKGEAQNNSNKPKNVQKKMIPLPDQ
ncbi:hypothetical protein TNCV_3646281 [Trichonephila clavipes]|nr:hypothetical protein TNCV_3646281 [Trichonephila clavipes]